MKFFEIDEEYLKKGGLITRDKKSGIAFGVVNGCLVAFNNGIKKEPEEVFKGYIGDLLASDWEYISYDSKKPVWKPEDDEWRIRIGNVFKTEEEAEKMIKKLQIINTLKELSNTKFVDDCSKLRYSVAYDIDTKKVCPTMNRYSRILPFELYFETAKDCQKAIDIIGKENLKKYYFEVVD